MDKRVVLRIVMVIPLMLSDVSLAATDVIFKFDQELASDGLDPTNTTVAVDVSSRHALNDDWRLNLDFKNELHYADQANNFASGEPGKANNDFKWRDLTLQGTAAGIDWNIGKQKVTWGYADGLRVLDQVNPLYMDEFLRLDFKEKKQPLWMLNARKTLPDSSYVQALVIPEFKATRQLHDVSLSSGVVDSFKDALGFPVTVTKREEHKLGDETAFGVEYGKTFDNGMDVTLNHLRNRAQEPVVEVDNIYFQSGGFAIGLKESFPEQSMWGGSLSTQVSEWLVRSEVAWFPERSFNTFEDERLSKAKYDNLSWLVGADYSPGDWLVSVQYQQDQVAADKPLLAREKVERTLTAEVNHSFKSDTLKVGATAVASLNNSSGMLQPYVEYDVSDQLGLRLSATEYTGNKENNVFSELKDDDSIRFSLDYEF